MTSDEWKSYRTQSRVDYGKAGDHNLDQLQAGAFFRMADALEVIAKDKTALTADRDYYKRCAEENRSRIAARDKTISALRGIITKLKKKII